MLIDEPLALLGLPHDLQVTGPDDALPGRFRVTEALTAAIGAAAVAHAERAVAQGFPRPAVTLDTRDAAASGRSELYARVDGEARFEWDPLSGLARAADGLVRLHSNYAHHRAALCSVLGIAGTREELDAAVATWRAVDLEDALASHGGIGVRVRSAEEWAGTPAARALSGQPLIAEVVGADASPIAPRRPRVLDLTRVLAGPVCTKVLSSAGCDVLRVDPPGRPENEIWVDTGIGKRTVLADAATLGPLIDTADVVVVGYRADALPSLRERLDRPGLVVVELNAWGWDGPWRDRRGFDSIVQAASGINVACGSLDEPGVLPAQALDHCTGYLAAAAALTGLARRATDGRGRRYRLSLLATARWLGPPRPAPAEGVELDPVLVELRGGFGVTTAVAPAYALDGVRPSWPYGPHLQGADSPEWLAD